MYFQDPRRTAILTVEAPFHITSVSTYINNT